jgi:hypothetical protein
MKGQKSKNSQEKIRLVDTRFTDPSTGKMSNWFGYLDYCTDLYNGMWKLEKILENIYKRLNELEISKKQQLSEIVSELEEIKTLQQTLGKISGLEVDAKEQCLEIKQIKQNNQQDGNTISSFDLALITYLATSQIEGIEVNSKKNDSYKIKYFAKVALARLTGNTLEEKKANTWCINAIKYNTEDYSRTLYDWCVELDNKSASEIVKMIKQIINSVTAQNESEHGQLTK